MPPKTQPPAKAKDSDDPEHLQALDESNTEWVNQWKKTTKKKTKKAT